MSAELKPCPMCGCKATFIKHSAGVPGTQGFDKWDAVACKHCRTTVGACDRRFRCREDAAEAWNRRAPQAAPELSTASRPEAVDLAKNMLTVRDCKGITTYGVRVLCEAVIAMNVALAARAAPGLALPEGFVLVPAEPDGNQWSAGRKVFVKFANLYEDAKTAEGASVWADVAGSDIYRAMLASRPTPEKASKT